jgi:hypothetical protein
VRVQNQARADPRLILPVVAIVVEGGEEVVGPNQSNSKAIAHVQIESAAWVRCEGRASVRSAGVWRLDERSPPGTMKWSKSLTAASVLCPRALMRGLIRLIVSNPCRMIRSKSSSCAQCTVMLSSSSRFAEESPALTL